MSDFPPEVLKAIDQARAEQRASNARPAVATPVGQIAMDIGTKPAITTAPIARTDVKQPGYQTLHLNICQDDGAGGSLTIPLIFVVVDRGDAVDEW